MHRGGNGAEMQMEDQLVDTDAKAGFERCLAACAAGQSEAIETLQRAMEFDFEWTMHALVEASYTSTQDDVACFALDYLAREITESSNDSTVYRHAHAYRWLTKHFDDMHTDERPGPSVRRLRELCRLTPMVFDPQPPSGRAYTDSVLALLMSILTATSRPHDNDRWVELIKLVHSLDFFIRGWCAVNSSGMTHVADSITCALLQYKDYANREAVFDAAARAASKLVICVSHIPCEELLKLAIQVSNILVQACGVSYEASESIGEMAQESNGVMRVFAEVIIPDLLATSKRATVPDRLRRNALWAMSLVMTASPRTISKNKKLTDEIFAHCIDELKCFGEIMITLPTVAEIGRAESTFSALHVLDNLSKINNGNPLFVKKLKRAITSLAEPSRPWQEHIAAVSVFMYGAEGVLEDLASDVNLLSSLGNLISSDNALTRFSSLRALSEVPAPMVFRSIPMIVEAALRDVKSSVLLFQHNAYEILGWIANIIHCGVLDVNDVKANARDSEDDVVDFGESKVADPFMQQLITDARSAFDAEVPSILETALAAFSTSPFPAIRTSAVCAVGYIVRFPAAAPFRIRVFDTLLARLTEPQNSIVGDEAYVRTAMEGVLIPNGTPLVLTPELRVTLFGDSIVTVERVRITETAVHTLIASKVKRGTQVPEDFAVTYGTRLEQIAKFLNDTFNQGLEHGEYMANAVVSAWNGLLQLFGAASLARNLPMAVNVACWAASAKSPPPVLVSSLPEVERNDPALEPFELVLDGRRLVMCQSKTKPTVDRLIELAVDLLVQIVTRVLRKKGPAQDAARAFVFDIWMATRIQEAPEDAERGIRYISDPLSLIASRTLPPPLYAAFVFKVLEVNFTTLTDDLEAMSFQTQSCSRAIERLPSEFGLAFFRAGFSNTMRFQDIVERVCRLMLSTLDTWVSLQQQLYARQHRFENDDDGSNSDAAEPSKKRKPRAERQPPPEPEVEDSDDDQGMIAPEEAQRELHNAEIIINHGASICGYVLILVDQYCNPSLSNIFFTFLDGVSRLPEADRIGEVRAATCANLNIAWWAVKSWKPSWPHATDILKLAFAAVKKEIDTHLLTFGDDDNGQTTFSLLTEVALQMVKQTPEVGAQNFPELEFAEYVVKAANFLLDKRSTTKKFGAAATNAVSFLLVGVEWRRDVVLGALQAPFVTLIEVIAKHLPCKGDAVEAAQVYARLALWLVAGPEHVFYGVPEDLKAVIKERILRSKYATEETKAMLAPPGADAAPPVAAETT